MKIVVIGGSGLIGKKLVDLLRSAGQEAVSASPSSGVNAVTGAGLADALAGARVVVDVSNAPVWEDQAVLDFFTTSTRNLLSASKGAGVGHYVALSVVGADRLPASGYMRAKVAQETLIEESGVPYTLVRATQFFEFAGGIADAATVNGRVRVPAALMQPILAADVSAALADIAQAEPTNGMVELAGPEPMSMEALVQMVLDARDDSRTVEVDPAARYFGTPLVERSLVPLSPPRTGTTRLADWLGLTASR